MATKTKIKESLKNVLIKELTDKKEEERLVRVKENSKLREITAWVDKDNKICDQYIKFLNSEGINLTIKNRAENQKEWSEVAATTNYNVVPTFFSNGEYLAVTRDFKNTQQALNALKYLGSPTFDNPSFDSKLLEHLKTNQYNLFTKLNQIQQQLAPITQFITNLEKELTEEIQEENTETSTSNKKEGGCGCKDH